MNHDSIQKLAFAQGTTSAVASAAAGVGIPVSIIKLAFPASLWGRGARALRGLGRKGRDVTQIVGSRDILGRGGGTTVLDRAQRVGPRDILGRGGDTVRNRVPMSGAAPSRMPRTPRDSGELDVAALRQGGGYMPEELAGLRNIPSSRAMVPYTPPQAAQNIPSSRAMVPYTPPQAAQNIPSSRAMVPYTSQGAQTMGQEPGRGRRFLKDWWTLPVAGAGVYGLGHMVGAFTGGDEGGMQAGYGQPSGGPTPQEQRYQQMMALAQRYGY